MESIFERFPSLHIWYKRCLVEGYTAINSCRASALLFEVCQEVDSMGEATHSTNPLTVKFLITLNSDTSLASEISDFLVNLSLDLYSFLAIPIEVSATNGYANSLLGPLITLESGYLQTPQLTFLVAWAAFNLGDFKECVRLCERIEQASADAYSLMGQAQIELGNLNDAHESLTLACRLAPKNATHRFQLMKAEFCLRQFSDCFDSIAVLEELCPRNLEVAFYRGILCLESGADISSAQSALKHLKIHSSKILLEPLPAVSILRLAILAKKREIFEELLSEISWKRLLGEKSELLKEIPKLLRDLHTASWWAESAAFINKLETLLPSTQNENSIKNKII